jgi:uncharacterized lipoprotein YajG
MHVISTYFKNDCALMVHQKHDLVTLEVNAKLKFTLEEAIKAQRQSRGMSILFL